MDVITLRQETLGSQKIPEADSAIFLWECSKDRALDREIHACDSTLMERATYSCIFKSIFLIFFDMNLLLLLFIVNLFPYIKVHYIQALSCYSYQDLVFITLMHSYATYSGKFNLKSCPRAEVLESFDLFVKFKEVHKPILCADTKIVVSVGFHTRERLVLKYFWYI